MSRLDRNPQNYVDAAASAQSVIARIGAKIANGETIKIAAFGDSTTDGYNTIGFTANPTDSNGNAVGNSDHNATAPWAWPSRLLTLLQTVSGNANVKVWNAGYGGKQILNGWAIANYVQAVINNPYYGVPDVTVIAFGLNDITDGNWSPDAFVAAYVQLVALVKSYGSDVIIMTSDITSPTTDTTRPPYLVREVIQAQRRVARMLNLPIVDMFEELQQFMASKRDNIRWSQHQSDGLHLDSYYHSFKASVLTRELSQSVKRINPERAPQVIAPWEGKYGAAATLFGQPNNNLGGAVQVNNGFTAGATAVDIWVWADAPGLLNYYSLDGDAAVSAANAPKIIASPWFENFDQTTTVYGGAYALQTTNRLSEIPQSCGLVPYGLCRIRYVLPQVNNVYCLIGYWTVTSHYNNEGVDVTMLQGGGTYSIYIPSFRNPYGYNDLPSGTQGVRISGLLPIGFGAVVASCRTFNNTGLGADNDATNDSRSLVVLRNTDNTLTLAEVVVSNSAVQSVTTLVKGTIALSSSNDAVDLYVQIGNDGSGQQQVFVLSSVDSSTLVGYTAPLSGRMIASAGAMGGLFCINANAVAGKLANVRIQRGRTL